mgnify:CR=1 FL=1
MDNFEIYNAVRAVPADAQREISAGRLKGKTDINPMWRLKALTEQFGPCGIGWKYEITRQWTENGAKGEISAFCNILLYIKVNDQWSDGIPGTGGSAFVANESKGPYTSDECYKMALTDALSVSCKALGMGADVYWQKDATKYSARPETPAEAPPKQPAYIGKVDQATLQAEILRSGGTVKKWIDYLAQKFPKHVPQSIETITPYQYQWSMNALEKLPTKSVTNHEDTV